MKGLAVIPSLRNLSNAYEKLQSGSKQIIAKEWALWSQWSRFDPRLAEQLVHAIYFRWKAISPIKLHQELAKMPWPSAMGVILEHVILGFKTKTERNFFRFWLETSMFDISLASFEQFFIGTSAMGGSRMIREASTPTKPYLKWGYFGKDVLWNKKANFSQTLSSQLARNNVLDELIQQKRKITVKSYMEAVREPIHIRQAQRDLAAHRKLIPSGKTNSRIYKIKPN